MRNENLRDIKKANQKQKGINKVKKKALSAVFAALAATCVCAGFSACGKGRKSDLDLFNFTLLEDGTYSISAGKA